MVAALWLCKKGMLGGMICLFEIVICIGRCSLKVCGEDSLMARLEHRLQPVVNYGIMPGRIIRIIHFNTGVFPVCSRIKFGSTQVQVWFNFAL